MKTFMAYILSLFVMNVFAEEPTTLEEQGQENEIPGDGDTPPTEKKETPKPTGSVNYEDLVRDARKQEKDKLYPQIEKLKLDKNDLLLVVGERDEEIKKLTKELAKYKETNGKLSKDLEDGTKTNKTVSELTLKISQLEKLLEDATSNHEATLSKIKLDSFKEKQIASANGELIPELVVGETEEEISASIELAKQRYAEIREQAMSGVQMPYTNPGVSASTLNADSLVDVTKMTHEEYSEYRKNLGIK